MNYSDSISFISMRHCWDSSNSLLLRTIRASAHQFAVKGVKHGNLRRLRDTGGHHLALEFFGQPAAGFRDGGSSPYLRLYWNSVPARSCLVSFTDSEGTEHSVRVPAESLYEAAVEAMAAFRRSVLAEMPLGSPTRLTIRVKAPEEEHTVTIGKVLAWLDGIANSPSEKLKKNRLKERLRT
jgi:hypothetical protein